MFHWFLTWRRIACHSRSEMNINWILHTSLPLSGDSNLPSLRLPCFKKPSIVSYTQRKPTLKNDNEQTSWQIGSDCGENGKEEGSEMRKYRFSQRHKAQTQRNIEEEFLYRTFIKLREESFKSLKRKLKEECKRKHRREEINSSLWSFSTRRNFELVTSKLLVQQEDRGKKLTWTMKTVNCFPNKNL